MNFRPLLTALTLTLALPFAPFAAAAQEAPPDKPAKQPAEDPDNAKTPLTLLELLPEDDKDWPKPFSLIIDIEQGGGSESLYMSWRIARDETDIVMGLTRGNAKELTQTSLRYSSQGKLKSLSSEEVRQGHSTHTKAGKVVGDQIEITSVYTRVNREPRRSTETIPLASLQDAVMLEWVPLVVAYHARKGHLAYTTRVRMAAEIESVAEFKAEDVGTEQVEVDGRQQTARVLFVEAYALRDGERQESEIAKLSMTFLTTGGLVNATFAADEMKAKAKRATDEEIEKRFGKAGAPQQ